VPADALVFIHLSDIHFKAEASGRPDDLDDDLRRQLIVDVVKVCVPLQPVTGVLLSGDVAARGSPTEYEYARQWLDELCDSLGLEMQSVWMVPGNHDIDRLRHRGNTTWRLVRDELRRIPLEDIDERLAEYHRDETICSGLYAPLENYSRFAREYDSEINSKERWWEHYFTLNDGSKLVIRGVNSSLICDQSDDGG
jgi:hypothetical protein